MTQTVQNSQLIIVHPKNTRACAREGNNHKGVLARFFQYVNVIPSGCWNWTGYALKTGYGRFHDGKKLVPAHHYSYKHFIGPLPEWAAVIRQCKNMRCVNPSHLIAGDYTVLCRASQQKAKTHCPKGHPYDESNTYYYRNAHGNIARNCKACTKERALRRWQKKKLEVVK